MFEGEFKVFFGDHAFIELRLPFGEDCGLVLGHTGPGQTLDKGVGVEGGLRLHEAQNSAWGGVLQVGSGAVPVSLRITRIEYCECFGAQPRPLFRQWMTTGEHPWMRHRRNLSFLFERGILHFR